MGFVIKQAETLDKVAIYCGRSGQRQPVSLLPLIGYKTHPIYKDLVITGQQTFRYEKMELS